MIAADVKLDWRAYFLAFCRQHGGDLITPHGVEHRGMLVFEDGWAYSATDYAGPEWPPPKRRDRDKLALAYWRGRRERIRPLLHKVEGRVNWLNAMQAGKSIKLQQRVSYQTEEVGRDGVVRQVTRSESKSLDLAALEEQAGYLRDELAKCNEALKGLS